MFVMSYVDVEDEKVFDSEDCTQFAVRKKIFIFAKGQ